MSVKLTLLLFAGILSAQTVTVKFQGPFCPPVNLDASPQILAFVNTGATVPTGSPFPMMPTCLKVGAGLRVNMQAVGGPALEFRTDVQIAPVVPIQVSETFSLKGVTSVTKDIVLRYGPSMNTIILLIYQDIPTVALSIKTLSVFSAAVPLVGSVLRIEIPEIHSDAADVTIVYWTNSGCAPDRPNTPGCV